MADFKFELNRAGVRELLNSAEMSNIINQTAQNVINSCGSGYSMKSGAGRTRVQALVYPDSYGAIIDNRKNKTLQKAVSGGAKI